MTFKHARQKKNDVFKQKRDILHLNKSCLNTKMDGLNVAVSLPILIIATF